MSIYIVMTRINSRMGTERKENVTMMSARIFSRSSDTIFFSPTKFPGVIRAGRQRRVNGARWFHINVVGGLRVDGVTHCSREQQRCNSYENSNLLVHAMFLATHFFVNEYLGFSPKSSRVVKF